MMLIKTFAAIVSVLTASQAMALDLRAPFELENAKVLPAKIRNPRVKNVFTDITGRYDASGFEQPLGAKLNKTISWNDLLASQATQVDKDKVIGVRDAAGLDANGTPGRTTGEVNTSVQVTAPVLAYGVTDKYTLAVAVPVYNVKMSADAGFVKSNDGESFIAKACESDLDKCNESAGKLNNAVGEKLKRLGYKPIANQDFTAISDVRVVGKYVISERTLDDSTKSQLTLKHELTAPTGSTPDPDNVLAVPVGDGQWDVGAGLIHDLTFARDFRWNAFGGYVAQLPAQMTRRLPTSATDSLSADKENLSVDLGDIMVAGTSLNYELPNTGISAGLGYNYQRMGKAGVTNGSYEANRYRLLENELPARTLHTAVVMAGISTVDFYKRKKFVIPLQANLGYSRALAGMNATTNSMFMAEMVLFF